MITIDHVKNGAVSILAVKGRLDAGTSAEFDPELIVPDPSLSLENGAIEAWRKNGKRMNIFYSRVLRQFCKDFGAKYSGPYKDVPKKVRYILMQGIAHEWPMKRQIDHSLTSWDFFKRFSLHVKVGG